MYTWFRAMVILTIVALLGGVSRAGAATNIADSPSSSGSHISIGGSQTQEGPIRVISPSAMGKIESLAAVEPRQPTSAEIERAAKLHELINRQIPRPAEEQEPSDLSIIQSEQNAPVGAGMPSPIANFDGVNNVNSVLPPDTEGDIGWDPATGKKYYIQWVNLSFQIWDVTNPAAPATLYGPAAGNTLFTSLGGICASNNDGDPIVLFDQLANRWLMSQFALGFPNNFHQCIAISASADPLGSWYLYDFQTSTVNMNDYPKFGVWPDGYYMSVNQFNGSTFDWAGAGVAVFERSQMLSGGPAQMIYIDVGAVNLNYGGMLPSDLDGLTAPPAGAPNYFIEWDDSTWLGDPADTLRIWEFKVDWANPANTTFGLNANYDPNFTITTTDVAPLCIGTRACIPQPGTTAKLDAIGDRLMYRLAYRNFGASQSLVTNHTVDVDPSSTNQAGIHWFELRNTGTGWSLFQEGVYAGDALNSENRWMASIAQDGNGNMALGYSVSSSSVYPSVRYTGRLVTDPSGSMPQGETTLIAGGGSQTHSSSRWGDYSMMGIDPQDDCTFWYTQEYYATTSSFGWQTRIGSFTFPSCTAASTGTLQGTVTDSSSNPIAGATISITGGYMTTTNASGQYSIVLPPGTYDVTASKYGYISQTVNGVVVNAGGTTTQDFTLAAAPSYTVTLQAQDASTGWPLYASVSISGYPGSPVFTDPVTGQTTVTLVQGTYLFTFHAMSGGYTDVSQSVAVNSNTTITALLNADSSCSAPGYQPSVAWSEGFEGTTFPPSGWSKYQLSGTNGFRQGTTGTSGSNGGPHSGTYYAWHNDDTGNSDSWLVTPQFTVPAGNIAFTFWQRGYWASYYTFHEVAITTDPNPDPSVATYTQLYTGNVAANNVWEFKAIDLSAYAGQSVYLAFHYQGNFADEWYLDDVSVSGCAPIPSAGLVVGGVFDANTNARLAGASVSSGSTNAVIVNASADPAIGGELYIIGLPSGTQNITASRAPYGNVTDAVNVSAGGVVQHDFYLPIGRLSVNPTNLTFTVPVGGSDSAPATLSNIGGASASYRIFAFDGTPPNMPVTGPFDDATRHTGPKNLNDRDSRKLRVRPNPDPNITPLAAGDVVTSWSTGLAYPWGIGFNTSANDIWLANIAAGGGDDKAYRFLTTGANTWETINLAGMGGVWTADMTYNPFTNKLWIVNVGGDNCIYELHPVNLTQTGNKICPSFGTSQRGLAYDPVTDTFFSGSWNDFKINRFKPDGTLLSSVKVNLAIAGLAYNPVTKHLFVLSNTDTGTPGIYDVVVLDASTPGTYPVVGAFDIMNGTTPVFAGSGAYGQAGMEIDCSGNLWLVDQNTQKVYVAQSGETNVCDWQSAWLSASPASGTLNAGDNVTITVSVNAGSKPVGTYQGYLRIAAADTPASYEFVNLPVTMNVITIPPTVLSIVRQSPTDQVVTSGSQVTFRVTFSEDVSGVDTGDFQLTLLSVPGANASITSVTPSSASIYDVTVDITGLRNTKNKWDGAIRLDIPNTATIQDTAANPLGGLPYTSGQIYSIVREQTFPDVPPSYWAWTFIERLFYSGITSGYPDGTYRPENAVTRAEMAIFLMKAKYGFAYTPPTDVNITFTDTGTHWARYWIEALKQEGITSGYPDGTYRPENAVTRAEMAVFLMKAMNGPSYTPPTNVNITFTDTGTHWARYWIEALKQEGITSGYPDGTYRPENAVTRAEMAVFLVKAFNLP